MRRRRSRIVLAGAALALIAAGCRCPNDPPVTINSLTITPTPIECATGALVSYTITWNVNSFGTYLVLEDDGQLTTGDHTTLLTRPTGSVNHVARCPLNSFGTYDVFLVATDQIQVSDMLAPTDDKLGPSDHDEKSAHVVFRPPGFGGERTTTTSTNPFENTPNQTPTKRRGAS